MRHIVIRQASSIFRYRFRDFRTQSVSGDYHYITVTSTRSGSAREERRRSRVDIYERHAHCTSPEEPAGHHCTHSMSAFVMHGGPHRGLMRIRRRGTYQKHGE